MACGRLRRISWLVALLLTSVASFYTSTRPLPCRTTSQQHFPTRASMSDTVFGATKDEQTLKVEYVKAFDGLLKPRTFTMPELVPMYAAGKSLVAELASEVPPLNSTELPARHVAALNAINVTMKFVREVFPEYYPTLKFITKKEGLKSILSYKNSSNTMSFPTKYENMQARRIIERCYSEMWGILFTLAVASQPGEREDLLFFLKPMVENIHVRDRNFALHLLLRGFFFPAYTQTKSGYRGNVHSVATYFLGSMSTVFTDTLAQLNGSPPPASFKVAYPFLLIPLACARAAAEEPSGTAEQEVCRLLSDLHNIDPALPTHIQQWVVESLYGHLDRRFRELNVDRLLAPNVRSAVTRATVARDLLMCSPAMDTGLKLDRTQFVTAVTELGRCIELLLFQAKTNNWQRQQVYDLRKTFTELRAVSSMLLQLDMYHPTRMRLRKVLGLPSNPSLLPPLDAYTLQEAFKLEWNCKDASTSMKDLLLELLAKVTGSTREQLLEPKVQSKISEVFEKWRHPYLLMEYYLQHQREPEVFTAYQRYLRALFRLSSETIDDIRYRDAHNLAHLSAFPLTVRKMWEKGEGLPGFNDPETLFMVGEDSLSCLAIRSKVKKQNRALLSYIMQGNVRVLGVKEEGRLVARAIVRLLVDKETKRPCLCMDRVYVAGGASDMRVVQEIHAQASELSEKLGLPIVRASTVAVEGFEAENRLREIEYRQEQQYMYQLAVPAFLQTVRRLFPHIKEQDALHELREIEMPVLKPADDLSQATAPSQLVELDGVAPFVWVDGVEVIPGQYAANIEPGPVHRSEGVREVAVSATYRQV